MLRNGDVVRLLPGCEIYTYRTYENGWMSGYVLKDRLGVVVEPHHDTPNGRVVVCYNYTMSCTWVTFPFDHLQLMRDDAI